MGSKTLGIFPCWVYLMHDFRIQRSGKPAILAHVVKEHINGNAGVTTGGAYMVIS